jgi:cytochrome c oxidase subunit II
LALPRKRTLSRTLVLAAAAALAALACAAAPAGASVIAPKPAHSPGAEDATTLYWIGLVVAVIAIVAVNAALIYAVRRFRSERGARPRQVRSGPGIQRRVGIGLAALALLLFVAGVVFTERAREVPSTGPDGLRLARSGANPTGADPLIISTTGQQWLWRYDYPNNAFSFYRLVVPVDTTVRLEVESTDVIHSWYVPELGGKVDAVPGKVNTTYFRADELGTYGGDSAQLSGQGYAAMRTEVEVVTPVQYKAFISRQRDEIQAAQDIVVKQAAHPPGSTPNSNETTAQAAPKPTNEPNPAADAGAQVFAANGCGGCHTLAAAGSTGAVGPNLDKSLAPDDHAADIEKMITDPNAEVVPGYPPNVMPADYGKSLTPAQLSDLVQFLIDSTPATP